MDSNAQNSAEPAERWPAWLPLVVILLATALLLWPLLFQGRVLYWGTPLLQFYPWRTAAAEMMRAGHLPLWLHSVGHGAPLLANHQTAPFYPPNLLFLIAPAERAMGYSAALHLLLAGVGMALFARTLRLSRFASLIGAITYMLSAFMVTRLNFPTMTCAAAWMPFLLLFGERVATRRRWTDALGLGLIIGLQFLAGHAQLWYYSLWALGTYVLWRLWTRRAGWRGVARCLLLLGMALILGLGLAAIQLFPTAELAMQSQRQAGAEYEFAMTYSFWPWRLITFFAPDFFGNPAHGDYWGYGNYWEDAGYVGILPLILVVPAIIGWRAARARRSRGAGGAEVDGAETQGQRAAMSIAGANMAVPGADTRGDETGTQGDKGDRADTRGDGTDTQGHKGDRADTRGDGTGTQGDKGDRADTQGHKGDRADTQVCPYLLGLVVVALVLAMGKNLPIYPLVFRYVPGFGFFQAPARFLYLTTIALATLAAIGADHLQQWKGRGKVCRLLIVVGLGLLLAGLAAQLFLATVKATFGPALMRAAIFLIASCLAIVLSDVSPRRGDPPGRAHGQGLLVLVLLADLLAFGMGFTPTTEPAAYHLPNRTASFLRSLSSEPFRIYTFDAADYEIKYKRHLSFQSFGAGTTAELMALRETLVPNTNVPDGVESAGNFDPLLYGRYQRLVQTVNEVDSQTALRLLGMMNVAYILQPGSFPGLEPIDDGSLPVRIYRNPFALPRAWIVPAARCVASGEEALQAMRELSFDPRQVVVLEGCPDESASPAVTLTPAPSSEKNSPAAIILHYRPNGVTIQINAPSAGYLVLADTFYPGWAASVDGKPAPIWPANYAFRAVEIEAGQHVVDFRYAPASVAWGAGVSGASLILLLVGWAGCRKRPVAMAQGM